MYSNTMDLRSSATSVTTHVVIKGTLPNIIGHTPELNHMLVRSVTRILCSTNNGNVINVHKVMSIKYCFVIQNC